MERRQTGPIELAGHRLHQGSQPTTPLLRQYWSNVHRDLIEYQPALTSDLRWPLATKRATSWEAFSATAVRPAARQTFSEDEKLSQRICRAAMKA